jgi:hypothetical protein
MFLLLLFDGGENNVCRDNTLVDSGLTICGSDIDSPFVSEFPSGRFNSNGVCRQSLVNDNVCYSGQYYDGSDCICGNGYEAIGEKCRPEES